MRSRFAYALRAAGTWEVRPASRVERIVSTYTGITPGTPSPPSSVGVRTRSVVLHSEPRALMPSECCTHRAARQRASVKTSQIGTPPWTGKMRRRHIVLPITSLGCEKDGESPARVLKNDLSCRVAWRLVWSIFRVRPLVVRRTRTKRQGTWQLLRV